MTVPAPDGTAVDGWAVPASTNGVQPAESPDDDLFGADWNRPKRTNRLTFVLVAALVATLAFAGGVAVQKKHDAGLAASATAGRARGAGGFGGATDQGGAAGQGGAGGQGGAAGQGGAVGQGGSPNAAAPAGGGTPVVIGTVTSISGSTLTITNFAGTVVTVAVPPTATVTTPGLGGLAAGATVSVVGTTNADGTVTATTVTSRKAG